MSLKSAKEHLLKLEELIRTNDIVYILDQVYQHQARIAIGLNQWSEAMAWCDKAATEAKQRGNVEKQLELLHIKLKAALKSSRYSDAREVKDELDELARSDRSSHLSTSSKAIVAISAAAYDLYNRSTEKTRTRLESIHNLDELPISLQLTVLQLKGAAEHRTAKFHRSRTTHRQSLELAKQHNDIIGQLTAVNNLMCECLERGALNEALAYYQSAEEVIEAVPPNCDMLAHIKLNLAETLFGQERYQDATGQYRELKQWLETDVNGESEISAPISSGLGLCLLATGKLSEAKQIYNDMSEDDWKVLGGVPAADVVGWFQGYMLWQQDAAKAKKIMLKRGKEQLQYQEIAGRRILWLAALFAGYLDEEANAWREDSVLSSNVARDLRALDNSWFLYFSKRWLQSTVENSQGQPS